MSEQSSVHRMSKEKQHLSSASTTLHLEFLHAWDEISRMLFCWLHLHAVNSQDINCIIYQHLSLSNRWWNIWVLFEAMLVNCGLEIGSLNMLMQGISIWWQYILCSCHQREHCISGISHVWVFLLTIEFANKDFQIWHNAFNYCERFPWDWNGEHNVGLAVISLIAFVLTSL